MIVCFESVYFSIILSLGLHECVFICVLLSLFDERYILQRIADRIADGIITQR